MSVKRRRCVRLSEKQKHFTCVEFSASIKK
jgi:hypothetical protein